MKEVILVDPFVIGYKGYSLNYSVGVSILFDLLKQDKITCDIFKRPNIHADDYKSWVELLAERMITDDPKIIAFSVRCDTLPFVVDLAETLKTNYAPDLRIILGGPHPSLCYQSIMETCPAVDYIIIGEGERVFTRLIHSILSEEDVSLIKGLVYRGEKGNSIYTGESVYEHLGQCNIKQYQLILDNYTEDGSWFPLEIGRGCQYNCTFCCTTKMWRRKFRLYDVNSIVGLIKALYDNYNIHSVQFIHDNILSSKDALAFLKQLSLGLRNYPVKWECSARIDNIDEINAKLLKEAKCYSIYLGIETASPKMQMIYKKNINLDIIDRKINILEKNNLKFVASFIIGHPEESVEDISLTLSLATRLRSRDVCMVIQLHVLSFVNGTELYEKFKDNLEYVDFQSLQETSILCEPIHAKLENKELYSYFYVYSKYKDEIKKIINNLDNYANLINMHSKSINYIQSTVGENYILDILNIYCEFKKSNKTFSLLLFLQEKNVSLEDINIINNMIRFENLISKNYE